ncbi:MAG: hypothetical protein LYZ70_02290 [Nitrososphaerales archaeon]|nr:hypothetical protein [Nitrososphaerales archaeon]
MIARLQLTIACRDSGVAKDLASVLAPDNVAIPAEQRFSMAVRGNSLLFSIASERIPSAFATAQSILRDVALFQEVWLISHNRDA